MQEKNKGNQKCVVYNRRHHYITPLASGGYRIKFAPSRKMKAFNLPPVEQFRHKLKSQGGVETEGDKARLRFYGLVLKGEGRLVVGREALSFAPFQHNHVTKQEVRATLEEIWPRKKCTEFFKNGRGTLKPITTLRKKNERVYHALSRRAATFGGIRAALNAYYPGLYRAAMQYKVHDDHIADTGELGREIKTMFEQGAILSRGGLCLSKVPEERKVGKKILRVLQQKNKSASSEEKYTFTTLAAELAHLNKDEVRLTSSARQKVAQCAERITEFYLVWAGLVGYKGLQIELDQVYRRRVKREFRYGEDKVGVSDLRMNDTGIEVKTGAHAISHALIEDICAKYSKGNARWKDTKKPLHTVLLFMQQSSTLYAHHKKRIQEAGITLISYDAFHLALQGLVKKLEASAYHTELQEVTPSAHGDLEVLVRAHEYIGKDIKLYGRSAHTEMLQWVNDYTTALIEQGKMRYERAGALEEGGEDDPF